MIHIRSAAAEDIPQIRNIAAATWPEAYGSILTEEQIRYMLQLFYSPEALLQQMQEQGHRFLMLEENGQQLAFASYGQLSQEDWKLHKIYILPGQQGKGLGRLLLDRILEALQQEGAEGLRLNVNRHNKALKFYERLGFTVIGEEDIDIGEGYFMNDYIMRLGL